MLFILHLVTLSRSSTHVVSYVPFAHVFFFYMKKKLATHIFQHILFYWLKFTRDPPNLYGTHMICIVWFSVM